MERTYNKVSQNVICHSGVKGQKWGERRYQNLDGSLTEEGRKHYGYGDKRKVTSAKEAYKKAKLNYKVKSSEFNDAIDMAVDKTKFVHLTKAGKIVDTQRWYRAKAACDAQREAKLQMKEAKDAYKQEKKNYKEQNKQAKENIKKEKVNNYESEYSKFDKLSEKASKLDKEAKELYKKTGKNRISQIINNIKGNSSSVKAYQKKMDEAIEAQDAADEQWKKVSRAYKKTGSNRIGRIINNVKYDQPFRS